MTTKAELLRAIRAQCVECFGGAIYQVEGCTSPKCSLYPYRLGKDPAPNSANVTRGRALSALKSTISTEAGQGGAPDPKTDSRSICAPTDARESEP